MNDRKRLQDALDDDTFVLLALIADTYEEEGNANMAAAYRTIVKMRWWSTKVMRQPKRVWRTQPAWGEYSREYVPGCVTDKLQGEEWPTKSAAYEALAEAIVLSGFHMHKDPVRAAKEDLRKRDDAAFAESVAKQAAGRKPVPPPVDDEDDDTPPIKRNPTR